MYIFNDLCQIICDSLRSFFRAGLHHDAKQGLRAGGTDKDSSVPCKPFLLLPDRSLNRIRGNQRSLCSALMGTGNIDQDLGIAFDFLYQAADRDAVLRDNAQEMQRRELTISRGHVIQENNMSRLFSAQNHPLFHHHLPDIAISHICTEDCESVGLRVFVQAHIAHDGCNKTVSLQISGVLHGSGDQRHDLVSVDLVSLFIHGKAAVRVTVEGNAHVVAALGDQFPELLQMGGTASGIDIDAQPPGKAVTNNKLFSGGEKSLIALCVLFAILKVKPVPLVILDEVEENLPKLTYIHVDGWQSFCHIVVDRYVLADDSRDKALGVTNN